jgi:hypothetical protein
MSFVINVKNLPNSNCLNISPCLHTYVLNYINKVWLGEILAINLFKYWLQDKNKFTYVCMYVCTDEASCEVQQKF